MTRLTQAPGSPSSALQTRYFGSAAASLRKLHFVPVEKNEPERPRSVEPLTVADEVIAVNSRRIDELPVAAERDVVLDVFGIDGAAVAPSSSAPAASSTGGRRASARRTAAPWITPTACPVSTPAAAACANDSATSAVTWP